jgi:Domain of unknown function (DUF4302)
MTKSIIFSLFILIVFSCTKSEVDPLFQESANKRAANQIEKYKTQLTEAQYGWKGAYYPNGAKDGGYSFYLKFDKNGNLTMYSDVAGLSSDKAFETTFQIKALQKPTLIFDTYSYLHELVNPDYNGGTGEFADLELTITEATTDKISLVGNRNNTELTLTKLTNTEYESVIKGGLANIIKSTIDYSTDKFINLKFPNGENSDIFIDFNSKIFTILYLKNGEIATSTSAFLTTPTGIQLKNPITLNGITVSELIWDNTTNNYYFISNGNKTSLLASIKPALPFIYGLGVLFQTIVFDPLIPSQSDEYKKIYNNIKARTITLSTTAPTRVIGDVYFNYFTDEGVFGLVFDYTRTYPDRVDAFSGVIIYEPSIDNAGNITFTRDPQTYTFAEGQFFLDMSPIVLAGVKELTDVIEKNSFTWDYDTVESKTAILRATKSPNISIKGTLF